MRNATPSLLGDDYLMKILHILPSLKARGAQVFARDLIDAFAGLQVVHQSLLVTSNRREQSDVVPKSLLPEFLSSRTFFGKVLETRKAIQRYGPDIVLAHGGEPFKLAVWARIGLSGPKVAYRKIGLSAKWLRFPRGIRIIHQRLLLERAYAVLTVGESMRGELESLFGFKATNIKTIYQGVDPSDYGVSEGQRSGIRTGLGIPEAGIAIIAVGALTWEKNQIVMLRAFKKVLNDGHDTYLILVGDGPERTALEAAANELKVSHRTIFLGIRGDVPRLLSSADIHILTSLTEGVPGVLIEANMAGIPSVAWDVAGAHEVIKPGVTGYLTPFEQEDEFFFALRSLIKSEENRNAMGMNAKEFAMERFLFSNCIREHMALFNTMLD